MNEMIRQRGRNTMGIPRRPEACENCYHRVHEELNHHWLEVTTCTKGPYRGPVYADFLCSHYLYRYGKIAAKLDRERRNAIHAEYLKQRDAKERLNGTESR